MKKILFAIVVLIGSSQLFASDWIKIKASQPSPGEISLISSNVSNSSLHFKLDGFWKHEVETSEGPAWQINVEDGAPMMTEGAPELMKFATSLIVPDKAAMKLTVVSSQYEEFHNVLMVPSKGNLSRQVDPATVPFEFGKYYAIDAFYPGQLALLADPYIVRDYRGQAVLIQPFQYNPVTKTLRVYYDITLKVEENGISNYNTINRTEEPAAIDSRFAQVYNRHFINYAASGNRYDAVDEYGKMLIISYGDFIDAVQPLADWRIMTGTPTEIVDVAEIGGSNQIKEYIQDAYDNEGVTFVLLVGDDAQVPSSSVQGNDSDVDYAYTAGNDHYPDLFIGRFSAENVGHVNTMVQRTLEYEREPIADTAWYTKSIGLGSNQGPGDDNEMDFEHIRNISGENLLPFTYNYAYEFFDGSQGGNDADGSPNGSMVSEAVNSGATIINYVGHGSTTAWSTSGFNNGNVNNLENAGKLPFIISVACVNGNFVNATCFAEAWLRATDADGEPTGAVATFMSTINQSWNPPMRGQDEMNDILTETYEDNIKRTFGGITMNGCMNMNDVYGSGGYEMTDTWTIFGDPSLLVRTAIPAEMTVELPDSLTIGSTSMTIDCDAEGGLVALSVNGMILGTATVEGGSATLNFEAVDEVAEFTVVVTAFNYVPFIGTVQSVISDAPFVIFAEFTLDETVGNDDGILDYAEEVNLTLSLTNIGSEDAGEVLADISTTNPYITLSGEGTNYGLIASGDTVSMTNAFGFSVAENVPDGEIIEFMISAENIDDGSTWESTFEIVAHAPDLKYVDFMIDDSQGNNNGRLDAGETVDLVINLMNDGSSGVYNMMAQLTTENQYVTIISEPQEMGNLAGAESTQIIFKILADGDTPPGEAASFAFDVMADHNISTSADFYTNVGQKPVLILNLTEIATLGDSLSMCLNHLQVGSDLSLQVPGSLDEYQSIFVILGAFPDNHQLTPEEGDALATYLNHGGRLYMEGSDTWYYDQQTPVHAMFNISASADGTDDIGTVLGEDDNFLAGYAFGYSGLNSYVDHIGPKTDALTLLSNESPSYGLAVSYENEVYKTIGASFSFSGLEDKQGSTKDALIAEVLNFFDIGFTWTDVNDRVMSESSVIAYPNPFAGEVNISLQLDENADVTVDIYDLTGRKLNTLVNSKLTAGKHQFVWNADDENGKSMEPGIYFYNVRTGDQVLTKKLILTR